jgi:competence protein ComEC
VAALNSPLRFLAGFSAGMTALPLSSELPAAWPFLGLLAILLVAALWRRVPVVIGLVLALAFSWWQLDQSLNQRLDDCLSGVDILLEGRVQAMPDLLQSSPVARQRFEFAVHNWQSHAECLPERPMPRRVRVHWYQGDEVQAGEHWRLLVRLRPPTGLDNPGLFDYEQWLLAARLDATGSVRAGQRLTGKRISRVDGWRQRLRDQVLAADWQEPGILLALLSGDSAALPDSHWQILRGTGTVHLLVVSGLHLGLVSGLGLLVGTTLARLLPPLSLIWPARYWGVLLALPLATLYATLAGWSLPVQRAWIMAVAGLLWLVWARRTLGLHVWLLALSLILLLDPLAPLTAGFWLSFGAVLILLLWFSARAVQRAWRSLIQAQLVLGVAMLPLLATLVGQWSWVMPLANLIAVPLVSLLLVPLVLLGGLGLLAESWLPGQVTHGVLSLADLVAQGLVRWLLWVDGLATVQGAPLQGLMVTLIGGIGAALMLLPLAWRWRCWAMLMLVCLLLPRPDRPAYGEFRMTMLDVGQGLAVLVETQRHQLLFDAGPAYSGGFDAGDSVVTPMLRRRGLRQLDRVLISHNHQDHAGGFAAIARSKRVRHWSGGGGFRELVQDHYCRAGQRWQWHGVRFEVLFPPDSQLLSANDGSCVLYIRGRSGAALLPGDIERRAEQILVRSSRLPQVDVLVAPHHGSRSSSSRPFLAALDPALVLISSGRDNRFGHPHPEVLARYRSLDIEYATTATDGALIWSSQQPDQVQRRRDRSVALWRSRPEVAAPR